MERDMVKVTDGKQVIKITPDQLDKFPATCRMDEDKIKDTGTIDEAVTTLITKALAFISDDELRPAMTMIQVHKHVAATDAHRLMFEKIPVPLANEILIPKKVAKLLQIFGGTWAVKSQLIEKDKMGFVSLINQDGVEIIYKTFDFKFPDWKLVIPEVKKTSPFVNINKGILRAAIKTGSAFENSATHAAILSINKNGTTYHTKDIDLSTYYETPLESISNETTEDLEIGFNSKLLDQIISYCGDNVKVNYWTANKCAIFDDKYLLMPLRIPNL